MNDKDKASITDKTSFSSDAETASRSAAVPPVLDATRRSLLTVITAAGVGSLLSLLLPSESMGQRLASSSKETKVTPLSTRALPDFPGKEVLIITVEYPPGGSDPIHKHEAHSFIYVLEGSIVMGVKGQDAVRLYPGQTFYEGPQDIHTIGRNASKVKPAKFLVFLIKNQNAPAVIPVN